MGAMGDRKEWGMGNSEGHLTSRPGVGITKQQKYNVMVWSLTT